MLKTKSSTNKFNTAIPSFRSSDDSTKEGVAIVSTKESGLISISDFLMIQLLCGFDTITLSKEQKANAFSLYQAIAKRRIATIDTDSSATTFDVFMERVEVELMKDVILARMKHCEEVLEKNKEYDNMSYEDRQTLPRELTEREIFNKETYVELKITLMDIKEWLMCTLIRFQ